ncbi:MAG: YafY family transcriptional regulator [Firmicutes bacterium]|nr:YafY family transcriptional regulator [Bacillota bacterium]
MSKTSLLFDLIMYVNKKQEFTAQDIAHEFNVSIRTAHRYLTEISELGVFLYTERGRNGGYRVLKNRVLPPISFDENEALAIFFAFQSLKYYKSLPFDTDISSASRKLYFSLPDDIKKKIDRLESILSFWYQDQNRDIPSPFLKEIIDASLENKIIKITYYSKTKDKRKEVKPIGLYANNGFWYMPALEIKKNKVKLFRVDRILSLENTHSTHEFSMGLNDWFNSYQIEIPIHLYVKLTREGIRQCKSNLWLENSITITENDNKYDGYIKTEIDKNEIKYITNYFLQLGADAKVIEPKEIIGNIKRQAYNLLTHYQD